MASFDIEIMQNLIKSLQKFDYLVSSRAEEQKDSSDR